MDEMDRYKKNRKICKIIGLYVPIETAADPFQ